MSRDLGTYNTLAFPSWVLHMPWLREKLNEILLLDESSPEPRALIKDDSGRWFVAEDAVPGPNGPWWHIKNEVLAIAYTEKYTDVSDVVHDINSVGIPHDMYEDTGLAKVTCEQTLGALVGSAARRQGIGALVETSLPDNRVVKRMPDEELLAMLQAGQIDQAQDHLKAAISSLRLVDPLDKSSLSPRDQLVEAFACTVGCASTPFDITDFVAENPEFVPSLTVTEKDRVLASLCLSGENTSLVALINVGFSIDAEAPRRVTQLVATFGDPARETLNPIMLTHLSSVSARNRAMDVLSEMEAFHSNHPTP